MARSSTTFRKGSTGVGRKGAPNRLTNDQRAIFDEAISHDDRVLIVKSVFARAVAGNPKDAAPYCKLIFEYVFSRPKIGHVVSVMDIEEIMTPEVCEGVWEAIQLEAREREINASKAKDQPRLEVIDAHPRKQNGSRTRQSR